METVVAFNTELSGLYDSKPPISKAKMAAITRAAMKAIKFYKHVVQSVEKFILKCKSEYKIPGLYVIDSIVRQSRHQFGAEKDVFAPRFARNMKQTFANLFRCAPEDKSRIIRVLNLWQKNNVFAPEVIQPLFDLADPNHPIYQMQTSGVQDISSISNGLNVSGQENNTPNVGEENHGLSGDMSSSIGHQTANTLDQSTIRQLQQLQQILIRQTNESTTGTGANQSDSIKFNKKLLDYDYGDDEEEEKSASPHVPNLLDGNNLTQLLKDPNVLRQLQTLQKLKQQEEKQSKLNEMRIQEEAFEKHLQNVLKGNPVGNPGGVNNQSLNDNSEKEVEFVADDGKIEVINLDGNDSRSTTPDRDRYKRRRSSRSRSRERGGGGRDRERDRRRRSRSRSRSSRSRSPKSNRRRSSRERERTKDKERDKEKEKEREYERERRRKGLPDIKKEHLSVCSTTLWVGHLSKLVQQEELSDTFGKYGDIVSIDMIHPRGCAFIAMNRRQDAHKAMGSLKSHKMQGRAITISWAAGKGVKSKEWKDYWDLDLGVSYIPWGKLSLDTDLESLEEGGMFDEDSMPDWMKSKLHQKKDTASKEKSAPGGMFGLEGIPNVDTTQPPPSAGAMMAGVPMVPQFPLGPVPRLMTPMGVPMPGNMVPGIPMPPNMVPGMPPPHMMLPPGGMVPGFPPMPPMDKSVPPPTNGPSDTSNQMPNPFMGGMHIPPMPHPPNFGNMGMPPQFQPPTNNQAMQNNANHQSDDHMDIEMEDESPSSINKPPPVNFNQPPPMFPNFPNISELMGGIAAAAGAVNSSGGNGNENRRNDHRNDDGRDRRCDTEFRGERGRDRDSRDRETEFNNRDRSRWGGGERSRSRDRDSRERNMRESNDRDIMNDGRADFTRRTGPEQIQPDIPIWRDNGPNFQPPNFNDNVRRAGGMNISLDVQNQPPIGRQHDFFDMRRDDFNMDDRRGGGGMQRDFFQNVNNRFGPQSGLGGRGSPMPLRGGPPPPFGTRLGPMFIRGPPRPGPPSTGFNFSDRSPFDREDRGARMRGGNNMMDRRGGRGNWRDDDEGNRRGGGGNGRYRDGNDRDNRNDRRSRDRNDRDRDNRRGDRDRRGVSGGGGMGGNNSSGDRDRSTEMRQIRDRRSSVQKTDEQQQNAVQDTEDDWDKELSEHNLENDFDNTSQDLIDNNNDTMMNRSEDDRNFEGDEENNSNNFQNRELNEFPEDHDEGNNSNQEFYNEDERLNEDFNVDHDSVTHFSKINDHFSNRNDTIDNDAEDINNTNIDDGFMRPRFPDKSGNQREKREDTGNSYVSSTTPLYDEPIDSVSDNKLENFEQQQNHNNSTNDNENNTIEDSNENGTGTN